MQAGGNRYGNDDQRDADDVTRGNGRREQKACLSAKVKADLRGIHKRNAYQADDSTCHGPQDSQQKALNNKKGQNLPRQGADGCKGADLINPFIHRHNHHIHDADQNNGDQHYFDKKRHQIYHLGNIKKRGELFPGMDLKNRLVLFVPERPEL